MRPMKWLTRSSGLKGRVDYVADRIMCGWAWLPTKPNDRLSLDIFYRGIFLGQTSTGRFRPDLAAIGYGDGRHGFLFHLPEDWPEQDVVIEDFCVATSGPLRIELETKSAVSGALSTDVVSFFGPYLAHLGSSADSTDLSDVGDRAAIERMCKSGTISSAFVSHLAHKYDQPLSDTAALWAWYLGDYATQHGDVRTPLSAEDLNILGKEDGHSCPFVASLFQGSPVHSDVERRYHWAIEESRRLFVEDCLVPPRDVDALRDLQGGVDEMFPLSIFMGMLRQRHAVLGQVPTSDAAGRRRLYALILLLGLRSPHYLAYMPSAWLTRMLTDEAGPSLLETTLIEIFGVGLAIDAKRYVKRIAARGFDVASQTFRGTVYRGHRVFGGPAVVTRPAPVDVQIIGLLRRRIGLGESGRRMVAALRMTGLSVNAVDYNIGRTNEAVPIQDILDRPQPARLNILHLNAEEIPSAYAYLPDVFSRSKTVAFPYWELNRPSAVHRLGLELVDEVWVASRFLGEVFGGDERDAVCMGMACGDREPATRAQGLAFRRHYGISNETFVFLTVSDALSWVQRKNPLGVIEAFQAAFTGGERVSLIVKTHHLQGPLSPAQREVWARVRASGLADPRIVLIDASLDVQDHDALLSGSDCLVSLHRAEGLGLDLLDALHIGLPLIATAYSGNMDFCSDETAWLVDYDLRPVKPCEYVFVEPGHVWAEPRIPSATVAMRDVYANSDCRRERVRRGRLYAETHASPVAFAARLRQNVERLIG